MSLSLHIPAPAFSFSGTGLFPRLWRRIRRLIAGALHMAAGDPIIDASGNPYVDLSGNPVIDSPGGNSCCCLCVDCSSCSSAYTLTVAGFTAPYDCWNGVWLLENIGGCRWQVTVICPALGCTTDSPCSWEVFCSGIVGTTICGGVPFTGLNWVVAGGPAGAIKGIAGLCPPTGSWTACDDFLGPFTVTLA